MKRPRTLLLLQWIGKLIGRLLRLAALAAVVGIVGYGAILYLRRHPQDTPWSPLQLDQPIGLFTGRKIATLAHSPQQCHAVLDQAHVVYRSLPATGAGHCGLLDGVIILEHRENSAKLVPADPTLSCPVSVALLIWQREVVQPAARRFLDHRVTRIDHLGTLNCRRMHGRSVGPWSEHATANAIDFAGFDFEDGSSATVRRDWQLAGPKSRFLHAVRDGACRLFATTLSPDYNEAHRDHLHLDEAARGELGWRPCR